MPRAWAVEARTVYREPAGLGAEQVCDGEVTS